MKQTYSLPELAKITNLTPRTIRFYISKALVDKPLGARKTAYYTDQHLQQLLTVINWQKAGLSLDAIYNKLNQADSPQPPRIQPSDVQVIHRIQISDGLELSVDLAKTQLSQIQVRQLAEHLYTFLEAESGRSVEPDSMQSSEKKTEQAIKSNSQQERADV